MFFYRELSQLAATDPYFGNVSLLLRGTGIAAESTGARTILDDSPVTKTISLNGDISLSSSVKKYGSYSMKFRGANEFINTSTSSDFNLTGDFTVEFWVYLNSLNYATIMHINADGSQGLHIYHADGALILDNGLAADYNSGPVLSLNTWTHIAICKQGSTLYIFKDGSLLNSRTAQSYGAANRCRIGRLLNGTITGDFNGYIDDLRITKSVARYTSNFTVPNAELPTSSPADPYFSNVALLLRGTGTALERFILDESGNSFITNIFDNTSLSSTVKKYGTYSIKFDGGGDYFTVPNNAKLNFGTSDDFTIEGWIYYNSLLNGVALISKGTNSTNSGWTLYYAENKLYFGIPYISNDINGAFNPSINTWYHLACTRQSGTIRLFVDGILVATVAGNNKNYSSSEVLRVGKSHGGFDLNGHVDDLRITKGVARYTANFTPPTEELPAS